MAERATLDAFGVLSEPATVTFQRLLPGPIERVWAYLTQGELRRKWLAAGEMDMTVGVSWADLGIKGKHRVRDLWRQKEAGTFDSAFAIMVPRHGTVFVKVTPVK